MGSFSHSPRFYTDHTCIKFWYEKTTSEGAAFDIPGVEKTPEKPDKSLHWYDFGRFAHCVIDSLWPRGHPKYYAQLYFLARSD